jgi:N utilization substance protein B
MNSKNKKKSPHKKRSLSRLMAIQIFFQNDFFAGEKKLEEIKEDVIENYLLQSEENPSSYRQKIDEDFLNNLISGLALDLAKIDEEISNNLKEGWSLAKLDFVVLQILRCGVFELKFLSDIPFKVVIDEYLEITASFFDDKKITFVNAVLESIAKKFRSKDFNSLRTHDN